MIWWWGLTDSGLRTCLYHIQSDFSKVPAKLEAKVIQLLCKNRCLSIVVKNHIKIPHVWPLKMWWFWDSTTVQNRPDLWPLGKEFIAAIWNQQCSHGFLRFFGPKKASKNDLMLVTVKYVCCIWCPKICSTFAESLNLMRGTSARSPKPVRLGRRFIQIT